ncbi:hypothetical protein MNBD_BACTEROID05-1174 [hydrothermal vent metagenome]|uniref:DUF1232 domain-containing protein n=1 Tax=hydrothermal vent metagenome TaxID=652676 RepID=A0A3B0TH10_9ZZZZ
MLKAMKEQLKYLAQNDENNFHVHLRARVGKKATAVLEDRLKELVLLMPDLVKRIYFYWNQSKSNTRSKKLGGYLLTYLYTPEDFLSIDKWGLFGYLDDTYFVAKVYTQVIDNETKENRKISGIDLKYYKEAKFLKKYVRGVIPKEAKKIDDMIFQLIEGNQEIYSEIFEK